MAIAAFRALRHRNYRLFFSGQLLSLTGTWITRIATSWLVYRLTGSALLLGVVAFAGQIPSLFLTPVAGVLADRWDRHRVLVATQVLAMLQSFALAGLTLTGAITVPLLVGLQFVQGLITAFDTPVRQALVVAMIDDRADLPNAIALNSSMFNASRIMGPSIGGILIALVGEGWCFFIDGVSYVFVIGSLVAMRLPPRVIREAGGRWLDDLVAGVSYVAHAAPIRSLLVLMAVASLAGMPYNVLMPEIAAGVLGGDADVLGLLMTSTGVGALLGAAWLATRHGLRGLRRLVHVGAVTFGVGLVLFSFARTLPVAVALLVVVGMGFMVQSAGANTLVQTLVEEEKRGRVMAMFAMAVLGMMPVGGLIAGWAAELIGAQATIRVGGLVCVGSAVMSFSTARPLGETAGRLDG